MINFPFWEMKKRAGMFQKTDQPRSAFSIARAMSKNSPKIHTIQPNHLQGSVYAPSGTI
jgi:hypothetical protein